MGMKEIDKKLIEAIEVKNIGLYGRKKLYVNGHLLGEYLGGNQNKVYREPFAWAKKQIPKRVKVINRNIQRLEKELSKWKQELIDITLF